MENFMGIDDKISADSENEKTEVDTKAGDKDAKVGEEGTNIEIDAEAVELDDDIESIDAEELEQLRKDLIDAQELAGQNQEEVLRARAEIENLRRRAERDVEKAHKYSIEKFAKALIPVVDSLEMGLAAASESGADIGKLKEGADLTLKMFKDATEKFGLETLDPMGEEFNPDFHQAMSIQETAEKKPNTVLAVMQKGYLLQDRLIRPAMVVVSKASTSPSDPALETDETNAKDKIGSKINEKA
jgi:molecular chaperone GrpE